jgi:hypothetical protein
MDSENTEVHIDRADWATLEHTTNDKEPLEPAHPDGIELQNAPEDGAGADTGKTNLDDDPDELSREMVGIKQHQDDESSAGAYPEDTDTHRAPSRLVVGMREEDGPGITKSE